MIFLDTNVVIEILNAPASLMRKHLAGAIGRGVPIAISVIVLYELQYGVARSSRPERNAQRLTDFLAGAVQVVSFEPEDAQEAGHIRAWLERAGTPIGPYDVLIAAQTRRRGGALITSNEREFRRVPGLAIENWSR
jgi:tRNA(fMet)-specific endonuclease VapC